jgi:hypothetical protein
MRDAAPVRGEGGPSPEDWLRAQDVAPLIADVGRRCESLPSSGTINNRSFSEAFQIYTRGGFRASHVLVRGVSDSAGLDCFDGGFDRIDFMDCIGPLRLQHLPAGTTEVDTGEGCTVADISGLLGISRVVLTDASLVEDFSPLASSTRVSVGGPVALAKVAPYVVSAEYVALSTTATSLSLLNLAQARWLDIHASGVTSLADFQPQPSLTCFSIDLEGLSPQELATEALPLCTDHRDGRQCPDYRGCWMDPI